MSRQILFVCLVGLWWQPLAAQDQALPPPQQPAPVVEGASAEPSELAATLSFANRPIVTLRARVLGRDPADRVASATRVLDELIADGYAARSNHVRSLVGGSSALPREGLSRSRRLTSTTWLERPSRV